MRVLDAGSLHTYKMGKNRKHRIRKSRENEAEESSDDGGITCTHIPKSVNFAAMRKAMLKPTCTFGECTSCALEASKSGAKDLFGSPLEGAAASISEDADVEPTIWVCLQCGHQGCDRNSRERHAVKHFETPHSCVHCIVANLTTWSAWCYTCDNDIPVEGSKRIMECVDFLRKQAGLPRIEMSHFQGVPRPSQATSPSDMSPTDPSPPSSQGRGDKAVGGKSPVVACQKVKGLSNLGNTCFFNAVMQNLCQTHSLEALLVTGCKKSRALQVGGVRGDCHDTDSSGDSEEEFEGKMKDLEPIEITPGDPGPLTGSLLSFVQEMNNGSSYGTVTPNSLFSNVCKKAPRFKGFQQQDSHELLRYLVDVIRNEEIKRAQSGILRFFKLPENINPKKVGEDTKLKIKEYGRQVKFTFLDSLFGGQLVSTITCEECKHISLQFESVLDLSLPVTEEKPQRPNQTLGGKRKEGSGSATVISEAQEDPPPASVGVDGFAERGDKPSKYMERKNKRLAKKEAKKKTKHETRRGPGAQGKSQDGEDEKEEDGGLEEEGEGEETAEGGGNKGACGQQSRGDNSKGGEVEDDNSSAQEDPSDADVEDNLESETSRRNAMQEDVANNSSTASPSDPTTLPHPLQSRSNLQHRSSRQRNDGSHSDCDGSGSDLPTIKAEMIKEKNIAGYSSGESPPVSLDNSVNVGIKDRKSQEVEKLANGVCNLDLGDRGSDGARKDSRERGAPGSQERTPRDSASPRTPQSVAGGSPRPGEKSGTKELNSDLGGKSSVSNHVDQAPQRPGSASHPTVNHCEATKTVGVNYSVVGDGAVSVNGSADHQLDIKKEVDGSSGSELAADETAGLDKEFEEKLTLGGGGHGDANLANSAVGGVGVGDGDRRSGGSPLPNAFDKKFTLPNHIAAKSWKEVLRVARYKSKTTLAPRYHPASKECSILSCLHQFTAAELLTGSNKVSCRNCNKSRHKIQANKDKKGSDMIYSNAAKQFLIMAPPAVLTLHLKRFEQVGYTSRKVNRHVEFPLILDIAPYCSSLCEGVRPGQRKVLYSLYGLVEHSGRLQTGHYTAYVKVRPSLGPLTSFLHQHPPSPYDYFYRYMEQAQNMPTCTEEASGLDEAAVDALVPPGRWFHVSDSRINEVTEATVLKAQAYLLFYERIY